MKLGDVLTVITIIIATLLAFLWDALLSTVKKDKVSQMRRERGKM